MSTHVDLPLQDLLQLGYGVDVETLVHLRQRASNKMETCDNGWEAWTSTADSPEQVWVLIDAAACLVSVGGDNTDGGMDSHAQPQF